MPLDPARTVAELKELRELTGDENGAQRVAWTDTWAQAREWLRGKLDGLPLEHELDEAGNQWLTLRGASERAVLIGGHIDSVPNGGWLDGCLNVMAGVEVLRRLAEDGQPAVTVRLVDWADEEGARFGRWLFGSSAAAGSMADQDELRAAARRATGSRCRTRCASTASSSTGRSRRASSSRTRPPTSSCTSSRGRCSSRWTCRSASCSARSASSGTRSPSAARPRTPARRRWRCGATRSPARRSSRSRSARSPRAPASGAVCTMGGVVTKPGIVTSVVETAECLLDQRHLDAHQLAAMLATREAASRRFAQEEDIEVEWERIWQIEPILFDAALIELADEASARSPASRTGCRAGRCTTRPRSRARACRR